MISSDFEAANTLNSFFEYAVVSLSIPQIDGHFFVSVDIRDPIETIIEKFSNHPNILKIN